MLDFADFADFVEFVGFADFAGFAEFANVSHFDVPNVSKLDQQALGLFGFLHT